MEGFRWMMNAWDVYEESQVGVEGLICVLKALAGMEGLRWG